MLLKLISRAIVKKLKNKVLIKKINFKQMKKILSMFAVVFATLMLTSCNDSVNGFLYDVKVDGSSKGDVLVTFPNGSLGLDGDANLAFKYSNDTTIVTYGAVLEDCEGFVDPKVDNSETVQTFAAKVNDGFDVALKDASATGEYHIRIHGYAKEPNTGIIIAIDKSFDYPAPVDETVVD